ncbi:hypothetical protein J7J39_00990 [bacterium]|nr:hypothetical protein [bacterium]
MEVVESKLAKIIAGKGPNTHIKVVYIFPSVVCNDKALQLVEFLKKKGVPIFVLGDCKEVEKFQCVSMQSFSFQTDEKLVLVGSLEEAKKVKRENKEGDLRVVAFPLNQTPQDLMRLRWIVDLVIPKIIELDFRLLNLILVRLF